MTSPLYPQFRFHTEPKSIRAVSYSASYRADRHVATLTNVRSPVTKRCITATATTATTKNNHSQNEMSFLPFFSLLFFFSYYHFIHFIFRYFFSGESNNFSLFHSTSMFIDWLKSIFLWIINQLEIDYNNQLLKGALWNQTTIGFISKMLDFFKLNCWLMEEKSSSCLRFQRINSMFLKQLRNLQDN